VRNFAYLGIAVLIFFGAILFSAIITSLPDVLSFADSVANRPESVTDIVMRSRTTASAPPPERSNGMWMGAGLLAVAMVFIGALFAMMYGGGNLLRQWRLTFRTKRPGYGSTPTPLGQGGQYGPLTSITPGVRPAQHIPAHTATTPGDDDYEGF
jgi:hypothetical protein